MRKSEKGLIKMRLFDTDVCQGSGHAGL
jgi:hypothetical protein